MLLLFLFLTWYAVNSPRPRQVHQRDGPRHTQNTPEVSGTPHKGCGLYQHRD